MADTLVIIPTYNEKENIEELISEIFRYVSDANILIVDDNSPDGTGEIVDKIAAKDNRVSIIHRLSGRGRGLAGIEAFKEAIKRRGVKYVIEMDADFSHDPCFIPDFIRAIQDNDIVIGSRFVSGGKDIERDFFRKLLSRIANFFIRNYLGLSVKDSSSGYRCFKSSILASFALDSFVSKGPAIIEEVLYVSMLRGYKIKEIPIVFRDRRKGKTKLSYLKLLRVFLDIILFKDIHLFKEKKIDPYLYNLRRFGFNIALGMNLLGLIMYYRQRQHFIWFISIGVGIFILAIIRPSLLKFLKKFIDAFMKMINKVFVIATMAVIFYLIFTPISVLLRLFGKDLLHQTIDKNLSSYWMPYSMIDKKKEDYEKMG